MPKNWFPLESNPSVMNEYVHNLGLDTTQFSFQDVLSTEEWALEMIPQPAVAVIMLFPVKESSESYLQQEADKILSEGQHVDPSVYYMKQTVGNACGTVGILHAAANARPHVNITPGSFLEKFFQDTASMSPEQIASFLEQDDEIESHHVVAAEAGQSAQDADPDTHFICFRYSDVELYIVCKYIFVYDVLP
jgi:ubiquitin carboxyl-terminal hydrolase L3